MTTMSTTVLQNVKKTNQDNKTRANNNWISNPDVSMSQKSQLLSLFNAKNAESG